MKTTLNVLLLALILTSCNNSTEPVNTGVSYFVANGLQRNLNSTFFMGEAKLSELKEMALDRSMGPGAQKRFKPNFEAVKTCEKAYVETVKQIESLRISVMKPHLSGNAIEANNRNSAMATNFDLTELETKANLTSKLDVNQLKKLIKDLIELRGLVINEFVSSNSNEEHAYSFKDPNISIETVRNLDDFKKQLDAACNSSALAPDDIEIVKMLYLDFTVLASDLDQFLANSSATFDQFSGLSISLMQLYEIRYMNYAAIRSRFGGRY